MSSFFLRNLFDKVILAMLGVDSDNEEAASINYISFVSLTMFISKQLIHLA